MCELCSTCICSKSAFTISSGEYHFKLKSQWRESERERSTLTTGVSLFPTLPSLRRLKFSCFFFSSSILPLGIIYLIQFAREFYKKQRYRSFPPFAPHREDLLIGSADDFSDFSRPWTDRRKHSWTQNDPKSKKKRKFIDWWREKKREPIVS